MEAPSARPTHGGVEQHTAAVAPTQQAKAARRTKQQTSPGRPRRTDRHPASRRADPAHLSASGLFGTSPATAACAAPPSGRATVSPTMVQVTGQQPAGGTSYHSALDYDVDLRCFPISELPSPNDDRTPERPERGATAARSLFFSPGPKKPGGPPRKSRSTTTLQLSDARVAVAAASLWRRLDGSATVDMELSCGGGGASTGWSSSEDDEPAALAPGAHPHCCNCDVKLPLSTELYDCRDGRRRWFCASCPSPRRSPLKRHALTHSY